jgi:hypothetical protein
MHMFTEPTGYKKTILSDLQGAWEWLRETVVENAGFEGWERVLFHIDEAMSWEIVRNLERMKPLVTLIRNLVIQGNVSQEIIDKINEIDALLKKVSSELGGGEVS